MMKNNLNLGVSENIQSAVENLYSKLPKSEQQYFEQKDFELWQTIQMASIRLGQIAMDVKDHFRNQGARNDLGNRITFEQWIEVHGLSKSMVYRSIQLARGYNKIQASEDPDRELMLTNYLALPKKYQEMIATDSVDPHKVTLILHSDEEYRNSPHFKALLKDLDQQKQDNDGLKAENQRISEENYRLTKSNANIEASRAKMMEDLEKVREENRHLQLQLDQAKHQAPEEVEVTPPDYEETKQRLAELKSDLADREADLKQVKDDLKEAQDNQFSREDIDDLQAQIDQLGSENEKLRKQIEIEQDASNKRRLAFERVSKKTSEILVAVNKIDVMSLYPDSQLLSQKELAQTDLDNLAQWFIDKATQLQSLLNHDDNSPKKIIDGEFKAAAK